MITKMWNTRITLFFLFLSTFGVKSLDIGWVWASSTEPSIPDAHFVGVWHPTSSLGGEPAYMARVNYLNSVIPAFALNSSRKAYFNLGGPLVTANEFELLVGTDVAWYPVLSPNSSQIPNSAIQVGYLSDGTILHACRIYTAVGNLIPGLIDPKTTKCNASYPGDSAASYEVLISSQYTQEQQNETNREQEEAEFRWRETMAGLSPCVNRDVHGGIYAFFSGKYTSAATTFSRIHHGSNLVPSFSYSIASQPITDYAFEGQIYRTIGGEVICGTGVAWQFMDNKSSKVSLPSTALPVGYLSNGTLIHACRMFTSANTKYASYTSGMFLPSTGECQVLGINSLNGATPSYVIAHSNAFEVLIRPQISNTSATL